jgi:hypothetical protein
MLERRTCERFIIPGSTIAYKVHGLLKRHQPFTDVRYPVSDVSKGGLSFLADTPLKEEKEVSILLHISEKEDPIQLEGEIAYVSLNTGASYRYRIGVQFKPFGTEEGFNSLEYLNRLEALEKTYGAGRKNRKA